MLSGIWVCDLKFSDDGIKNGRGVSPLHPGEHNSGWAFSEYCRWLQGTPKKKSHWNTMQLIMTFRQYQILIFSCSQKYLWSEKEWSAKRCISKLRLCQIQTGTIFLKCTIRCQNHFKLTFLGSTSGYWRLHRKKFQAWKSNQSNNICIFCFHRKLTENWTQCFKHKRYLIVLLKRHDRKNANSFHPCASWMKCVIFGGTRVSNWRYFICRGDGIIRFYSNSLVSC